MKYGAWESYRFYVFITNFVTNAAWFLVVTSGMSDICSNVRVYVLINIKYIFVCVYIFIYVYKNYESQTSLINSPPASTLATHINAN
jgi:hypothetical protein